MMHSRIMMAVVAMISLQVASGTAQAVDHMRCEAKKVRCESRLYDCLSRCARKASTHAEKGILPGDKAPAMDARCSARCEDRARDKLAQIESVPPCKDLTPVPNPYTCRARILRSMAKKMVCDADCDESKECLADCDVRFDTQLDEIKSSPVCKNGWGSSPAVGLSF